MKLFDYDPESFYDELFSDVGVPRSEAVPLIERLHTLGLGEVGRRQREAQNSFFNLGVTFNVYGDRDGAEKIFPFDTIPRIVPAQDWLTLEKGLKQRITALNIFLSDIYGDQKIINDGIIPRELIESASGFQRVCMGLKPPGDIWCHVTGTDVVRDRQGNWYVLEDNLRCPSGVSYVLENRRVMKSAFPQIFEKIKICAVEEYPSRLLETLVNLVPDYITDPTVALLTPGIYNSAYFEHSFLAQQMGVELVEGRDLAVIDGYLQMRTTKGFKRVDVLYRRIDDDFIDPLAFRPDSLLGVPGLMEVYRNGRLGLANALGTGVADDKAVYAYVPKMINYYLGEEPILPNVPTYLCWEKSDRAYVLENLKDLVVKATNESGGYGMLIGPHSTEEQCNEFSLKIKENPRNYIAQPTLELSRTPTLVGDGIEGRHVDLRPYILYGKEIFINPGGLTRVALKKGSLVVNSSQGGGSKDTWVICD